MTKYVGQYVAGAFSLALFCFGLELALSLKFLLPDNAVSWIGASRNPRLLLWVISIFIVSAIMSLSKFGVVFPFIKSWFENKENILLSYIFGLPIQATLPILIASAIGIMFLWPVCESPIANFRVTSLDSSNVNFDGKTIMAKNGAVLTIEAAASEKERLYCTWSSSGQAITMIGPLSSCTTQVDLSNETSKGIITLAMSKSSCSAVSTRSLEIVITP